MLEIDPTRASGDLLQRYHNAKPSLRLMLQRRLRVHLGGDGLAALAAPLASSTRASDRKIAALLGASVPSHVSLRWLEQLTNDTSPTVQQTAREALRQRKLEAAAMTHRDALLSSSKPQQWARLSTIFELADPFYLWARDDPTSLGEAFDALPYEFLAEARQLYKKQIKQRDDAAANSDRTR